MVDAESQWGDVNTNVSYDTMSLAYSWSCIWGCYGHALSEDDARDDFVSHACRLGS